MKAGLDDKMTDTGNFNGILPEWEKKLKDIKIPAFFNKMPQETGKTFPHSKQVGNYLVGKMINKGSFAKVMEGLHIPTGEKVAIKVIDKKKAKQDSYVLKNMKREPRIHQLIKHPNIVQLYETLETDNSYYMVMELCLGGDLLDRICDKKRLAEWEVRRYIRQILFAVEHLHCRGIVHRDLKIENFLLDEYNNIKIVDFGLSNTAKFEGVSQELLHTQCGSPAYAAPELLAHRRYGPKVDVWSIGVSMFAMLTGTLPFTVEPFNIKLLHQKMLIGEISPIPSDISPGAVHFMQSLLEPDPAKRPGVKEAIKDKWLNEGFTRNTLNTAAYENRLCPSELNPVVLNYMTENMEFSLSEVINNLINNRPSPAMASYCLLLKKLLRYQKDHKRAQRENETEKHSVNLDEHLNKESEISKKTAMDALENVRNYGNRAFPSVLTLAVPDAIQENEIAVTLENQEKLSKVSKFADKILVHLSPPKSSSKSMPCERIYQQLLDSQKNQNDFEDLTEARKPCLHEKSPSTSAKKQSPFSNVQAMTSASKLPPQSLMENKIITRSPLPCQDMRFKDLLNAVDDNIYIPTQGHPDKGVTDLLMIDSPQLPPFPRLRQAALRETLPRKISLLGASQEHTNICPLVMVKGSKPSVFHMLPQQTFTIKSMRQFKENPTHFFNKKTKKTCIQLRHLPTTRDLSLPVLSPPYQTSTYGYLEAFQCSGFEVCKTMFMSHAATLRYYSAFYLEKKTIDME
ncbi:hormonally up-regulated neu tumor-associated kinase-like protein [Willisornis vidua]|uniref:non-specific serine/threonine protein kinase n=1 Tax=Willisornis vidua TaxID=1566151 RepID=A0ABQ9CJZ8_9PASS|nr:hormonally up-regulated neu tumor-associated kinase-like protein [Willisornis vidua]